MTRRLILNSVSAAILYAVNIVIAFVMSPVVVRALGNRDYGIWEMLLSFCGYFGILELGLGPAIIRFVAREMALDDLEGLNRIFNTAFWGFLLVGLVSFAAMTIAAINPYKLFNLEPGEIEGISVICFLTGLNLLVQFIGTLFVGFLMGRQEHFLVNTFRSVFYSAQAVLVYLALTRWEGSKLIWLSGIALAGNIFQYGVLCGMVFSRERNLSFKRKDFSCSTMKELYRFGLKSALLMVSNRIQRQSLPIVIGHTIGASFVVFYAIPKRLVDYAGDFVLSIGLPLMPYLSGIDALRRQNDRMKEWIPLSRAFSFISLPAAVSLAFLGEPFINLWIGVEYGEKGRWVLIFLSLSLLVTGLFSNSSRVLIAAGLHGTPAKRVLLVSMLAFGAAVPMITWYGVSGGAFVLMGADLAACWIFWSAASRHIGIGLTEHLRSTVKPLCLPVLFLASALAGARICVDISGYRALLGAAGLGWLFYLLSAWQFGMKPAERSAFRSLISRSSVKTPGF